MSIAAQMNYALYQNGVVKNLSGGYAVHEDESDEIGKFTLTKHKFIVASWPENKLNQQ